MMKAMLFSCVLFSIIACKKNNSQTQGNPIDSTKIIDSINNAHAAINEKIRNKNHFELLTGTYTLTHNMIPGAGKVYFTKVEGNHDEYLIKGEIKSGKDEFTLDGTAIRVSDKYFNFTGTTEQRIQENDHGKTDRKTATKTFMTKDAGKSWKMQGMVNSTGFVDEIIIKKK